MTDALLEAVRGLWLADPELGLKPLLTKLRQRQPDLGAGTKEVREALTALKAKESEGMEAIAAAQLATEEMVPPNAAFPRASGCSRSVQPALEGLPPGWSRALCVTDAGTEYTVFSKPGGSTCDTRKKAWDVYRACHGCARSPSEMGDGRQTHPECQECFLEGRPTLFFCGLDCPANPGAWKLHAVYHKKLKMSRKKWEDGGARQQRPRELAERVGREAAQTGDEYDELLAEGARYASKEDWRKAAKACREAIALRPDKSLAYLNLGAVLSISGHVVEAAQRYLEAKERMPVGSKHWAVATAEAFNTLGREECDEVAKPEWWNDEGLKALSARVVRAAPNEKNTNFMRAEVLRGVSYGTWGVGPRSVVELKKAATHYARAAALCHAPAGKAEFTGLADLCRRKAGEAL